VIEPDVNKECPTSKSHVDASSCHLSDSVCPGRPALVPPATSFASAVASMGQPLHFFTQNVVRYPDIFRSGLLGFSAYVIHHPEFIRHVLSRNNRNYVKFEKYRYLKLIGGNGLVTNEGESWVRQRRLVQPAFNQTAIVKACNIVVEETRAVVAELAKSGPAVVDVCAMMGKLALGIVARTLFGSDVTHDTPQIRRELDLAQRLGTVLLRIPLPLYSAVPYLPVFNEIVKAGNRLRTIVTQLITRRRLSGESPGDLLDRLMASRDEQSDEGMAEDQLVDEVVTLLVAGHETLLVSLSWSFYMISRHPEIYNRLHDESSTSPGFVGTDLAELEPLAWARAIAREVMRLYPPAYLIGRCALKDDALGDYKVPAGTNVIINTYGMHRHPKYWEDPDAFRPERMLRDEAWDPSRFTYLPFGAGPRSCIGARFAISEMQLVLSQFARAFAIKPESNAEVRPAPRLNLEPVRPIRLQFIPLAV
jgi:cytochrome P450